MVDHAFAPAPESSSGESRYSGTDAFCLGVGLDLLDAGFKQSEVVFLMYYLRPHLETGFRDLLNPPSLLSRSRHLAKNHSGMPTFSERGVEYADARVFILIQRKELKEIYPNLGSRKRANPVFLEPAYCGGIEILRDTLHKLMPFHSRILTIVEITRTAQAIQHYLDEAPEIRKGRPKSAMTNA